MANADAAFGLRPVRYRSGKAYTGGGQKAFCWDTSTALAVGDPVVLSGTGNTATGVPEYKRAAAAGPIDGVITGFLSDVGSDVLTRDFPRVVPAVATAAGGVFCLVENDPEILYEIQEDSVGNSIDVTEIGLHANVNQAAPDSVNGISGVELDSSSAAADTTGGLAVKIVGLAQAPDNALGTNAIWEVVVNTSTWRGFGPSR